MLTAEYIAAQRQWLEYRLESKTKILAEGGQAALSHSSADLTRIRFALRRIEDEQYGICTNCGCLIETDRLDIIPETPFCAPCAATIRAEQ
jgi:RNA polymerase-binding transcription factor DksA